MVWANNRSELCPISPRKKTRRNHSTLRRRKKQSSSRRNTRTTKRPSSSNERATAASRGLTLAASIGRTQYKADVLSTKRTTVVLRSSYLDEVPSPSFLVLGISYQVRSARQRRE